MGDATTLFSNHAPRSGQKLKVNFSDASARTSTSSREDRSSRSPSRSPKVRGIAKTAGLAALSIGGATGASVSTAVMPSTLLPVGAAPSTPIVDTHPLPRFGTRTTGVREVVLPVEDSYQWPEVAHFAFYDHTGSFPQAWSEHGYPGISVADRHASVEPPYDWLHVVGTVQDFISVYPYPIGVQTNNVTCSFTNLASAATWKNKVVSGELINSAREFLWINHIGDKSAGEQPPSSIEFLVGAPTFTTDALDHFAARQKSWCWWTRGLPIVPAGRRTPEHHQLERRSASDAEGRMLVRTETEIDFARDHVAAWCDQPWRTTTPRPAAQPSTRYEADAAALEHNYNIFKSAYAPTAAREELQRAEAAQRYVIAVPLAYTKGPVALLPSASDRVFAVPYDPEKPLETHYDELRKFLPCDATPFQACLANDGRHVVAVFPNETLPLNVMRTTAQRDAAADAPSMWCGIDAMHGTATAPYFAMATARVQAASGPTRYAGAKIGVWDGPRPVVRNRASNTWERSEAAPRVRQQWTEFIALERHRATEFAECLRWAGPHAATFAAAVVSAADFEAELPVPEQGLPRYDNEVLRLAPTPPPPMPLSTEYLTEVPPQQVPPGYADMVLPLRGLMKRWPRVELAEGYTLQAQYDHECRIHGSSLAKRPGFMAFGDGAFVMLPYADGIGSFRANIIIWERTEAGYVVADITVAIRDHKKREVLMRVIGVTSDQELLYFCLHGVRWLKREAPRQQRFGRNVESLATRVAPVGHATAKLLKRGLYKATKLRKAPTTNERVQPFDPDIDNFLAFVPSYDMGCGGQDKADNPDEARKTGNSSDPPSSKVVYTREVRKEDRAEGQGVRVLSFNDLTGPRKVPADYDGPPLPFPDKELKSRPRDLSNGIAVVSYLASLAQTYVVGIKDDFKWFFWQFYLHYSQLWLSVEHIWVPFDVVDAAGNTVTDANGDTTYEWWFCAVVPYVMNMGTRPASKIACRFSEAFQEEWRNIMRKEVVPEWLKHQTPELQEALADRRAHLQPHDWDPFCGYLYTDDFAKFFVGPWLGAMGAQRWRQLLSDANVWVSAKTGAGTVIHSHGARYVLNGGFTCLTPNKHARGIECAYKALTEGVTRDELVANNSFFVHVHDIANLRQGTLKGVWAPLKVPGVGTDIVRLTKEEWPRARQCYLSLIEQLRTRASASFYCAVEDAHLDDPITGERVVFSTASSDACTDPIVGLPQVVGWLDGCYWRFELDGEWLRRHITVTEALGIAGNVLMFGRAAPAANVLLEGDATAGLAMVMGTTDSVDLQYMSGRLRQTDTWAEVAEALWAIHSAGAGNIYADLGSRNKWSELAKLAAAFGIKLRNVDVTQEFQQYAADVLQNTTRFDNDAVERQRARARRRDNDPLLPVIKYRYGTEAIEHMYAELNEARTPPMFDSLAGAEKARPHPGRASECTPPMFAMPHAEETTARTSTPPRTPPMLRPSATPDAGAAENTAPRDDAARVVDDTWERSLERGGRKERTRDRSPQPISALAARRAAALTAADRMAGDDTKYAICPDDPDRLRSMCIDASVARSNAIPKGTRNADEWGFGWAVRFGKEHDTPWMRPRVVEPQWVDREAHVLAFMLMWFAINMRASTQRAARGFHQAMPDSPMNAMYAYRRVLRDCGRYLAPLHLALAQLRALRQQYIATWGTQSLVPAKHRPIADSHIAQILAGLANCVVKTWTATRHAAWTVLVLYELVTGTRNDEVAGEDTRLQRDNFVPVINGVEHAPTTGNWKRLRNGDYIKGKSAPSKCDRTNALWGSRDMWFLVDDSNPRNFAAAWIQWETTHPCPEAQRSMWPAFSPSGDNKPFTTDMIHRDFKIIIGVACDEGAKDARFHDFRATLATKLVNDEQPDAVVQALLRWKTPDSIRVYAEMAPSKYAALVEKTTITRAPSLAATRDIPEIEPSHACARIEATLEQLSRAVNIAPSATTTPAEPSTPATTKKTRATPITTPATKPANMYDVGELGEVWASKNKRKRGIGEEIRLPAHLWPNASNSRASRKCTVVAWAPSLSKYVILAHNDGHHYAMPSNEILGRLGNRYA